MIFDLNHAYCRFSATCLLGITIISVVCVAAASHTSSALLSAGKGNFSESVSSAIGAGGSKSGVIKRSSVDAPSAAGDTSIAVSGSTRRKQKPGFGSTTGNGSGTQSSSSLPSTSIASEPKRLKLPSASSLSASDQHAAARIDGDLILGGLFPVHSKGQGTIPCGSVQPDRGIQRMEAMLFTIDHINKNPHVLPDVRLGAHVLDTCSRDTYSLDQSLEFVRASLNLYDPGLFRCSDGTNPRLIGGQPEPVIGVVGGSYSSVSIQVANLLRLFKIPQVSYASTSEALSDKTRFEFFARTVPPDNYQAKAMADIVEFFNWTYVNTVASEGEYGESGIDAFRSEIRHRNICIAVSEKVSKSATPERFDEIIKRLLVKTSARVVILFLRVEDARDVLAAARRQNISGHFVWIASDGWGKEESPVRGGNDVVAEGALTIELQTKPITAFDSYFRNLTPATNIRNPWFRDYWAHIHNCVFATSAHDTEGDRDHNKTMATTSGVVRNGSGKVRYLNSSSVSVPALTPPPVSVRGSATAGSLNASHQSTVVRGSSSTSTASKRLCTGKEPMTPSVYTQESKIQFVYDAVYAFAYAMHAMVEDYCGHLRSSSSSAANDPHHRQGDRGDQGTAAGSPNRAEYRRCVRRLHAGAILYKYLLNVTFNDGYDADVSFDKYGDSRGRYNIMNYRRNRATRRYEYITVGRWSDDRLYMEAEERTDRRITWTGGTYDVPLSECSRPCDVGQIKRVQQGDACCWVCVPCEPVDYLEDEKTCRPCMEGYWPTADRQGCYKLEEEYMRWSSPFAIAPAALSIIGVICTGIVVVTFLRHFDTPVVKAAGRELSFMLFAGFLICYLMTFVILAKPGPIVCGAQRFGVGFGFAVTYSALLTKTNRIARIFDSARHSARRPPFISPKSQVLITLLLISVQVVGGVTWLIVEPPDVRPYHPFGRRDKVVLKCRMKDHLFLLSLLYNMILIIICTIYAVKTRRIPENFNESKHIGFAMYTTCVIWLAFIPIYFGTLNSFQVQITTLCVSISLSATVALVCLFAPKLHIIAFQSDKNVRKLTMNTSVGGGHSGGGGGGGSGIKKSVSSSVSTDNNPAHRPPSIITAHKRYSGCASTSRAEPSVVEQLDLDQQQLSPLGVNCSLSINGVDRTDCINIDQYSVASL